MLIADRRKSYEIAVAEPFEGLALWPPWSRFSVYAELLKRLAGVSINVGQGSGAVLSHFIRSAWDHLVRINDGPWPRSATCVIWDLFEALLKRAAEREASLMLAESLCHAQGLVDASIGRSGFKRTEMAQALGVSPRYLRKVFAEVGTTPAQFLITRRLGRAAQLLKRVESPRSITDIAAACGFNDLSSFSRAFRQRYGISAREYRRKIRIELSIDDRTGAEAPSAFCS